MSYYAPIALFVYKRLDLAKQTIEALQKNHLAKESNLYIFSDAPRSEKDARAVADVRAYIANIDGFSNVTVIHAPENQGCAQSIISGVSRIFEEYENIIVLEDDLLTTPNFLDYMNAALNFYANKPRAFAVAAWSIALNFPDDKSDVYFLPRTCSWGWASWKDRWQDIDWNISDYHAFARDAAARRAFNRGGADLAKMLDLQMAGKIDSWAIRWCYAQYKVGALTVFPKTSKAQNIGFSVGATHTHNAPNYPLVLDSGIRTTFTFSDVIDVQEYLLKQLRYYYGLHYRIKNKLRNYLR